MTLIPGTPRRAASNTSVESCWQTPQWLVERIREALGGAIDLDPCTTYANPTKAKQILTPAEDGLLNPWPFARTIYVNPPFIDAAKWAHRTLAESRLNHLPRTIFLAPAAIGTKWLHELWESSDDALFLSKRIRYEGICVYKKGKGEPSCCLGPDDLVHAVGHSEYHRYTEGSPTRGTVLFALNGTLRSLSDLGTRGIAA